MSAQPALAGARPPSDVDLVERIRRGDARAMEALMRRHNRALYRTARAILRDDAEAEDAVQDAYIRAFRSLAAFRGDSSVSTWLVRIAANEALQRLRRHKRLAQVIPIDHDNGEALMRNVADDHDPGPERSALNGEVRRIIERGIDGLPDIYRVVFVMRAVQEMTVEETAAALDLPEATVRTRFFRARALMRAALEADVDQALVEAFAFDGARCDRIVERVLARMAIARPA
jgi:RNA polymerase sigma-70 factor (ECF subfamily)